MPAEALATADEDLGEFAQFIPSAPSPNSTSNEDLGDFGSLIPSGTATGALIGASVGIQQASEDLGDFHQLIPVTPTSEAEKALSETPTLEQRNQIAKEEAERRAGLRPMLLAPRDPVEREQAINARQRLQSTAERLGVPHFIGSSNEPEGDRAPTIDMENIVAELKRREEIAKPEEKPVIAKERSYWENEVATNGMSADEWKKQTGENDPVLMMDYKQPRTIAPKEPGVGAVIPTEEPMPPEYLTSAGIPTIPEQETTSGKVAAGLANIPIGFANFMLSPVGIATAATTGGLPKIMQTLVGAGFTADQIHQFLNAKTLQDKITTGVGAALLGLTTAVHAKGRAEPTVPTKEVRPSDIETPFVRDVPPETVTAETQRINPDLIAAAEGKPGASSEAAATIPTLRPGEKGTADLFQEKDQPFNLAGERGVDNEAIQRARDTEAAAAEEALAKQNREQTTLPLSGEQARAEQEYRASLEQEYQDYLQGEAGATELYDAVAREGGMPAPTSAGAEGYRGELASLSEAIRKNPNRKEKVQYNKLFSASAKGVDNLVTRLRDRGFDFETPDDFLKAMDTRVRTEKPHYGFAEQASRVFGDMGLGLKAAQVPGFETVAKPWVDTIKSFVPIAKGIKRFAETAGQRDEVAAKFDAANNAAGYVSRQARNHVRLAGDNALKQQAATFVRQANGDKAGMIAKLEGIRGKGYDNVIEYAIRNWDSLEPIAAAAKQGTDAAFKEAEAANVNVDYRDNYVKGAYHDPVTQKVIVDETTGGRGAGTSFKKGKVFNDYAEAIAAGFKPKELRLDTLTESAVNSMLRVVNRKKWAQALGDIKMPDGSPITTEFLVDAAKPGQRVAPRGYKPVQVAPGDLVAVQEDIAPTIQALTSESMIPKLITHGAAFLKHNILVFDIFHGSRFAQMQGAFEARIPSYHKGLALLEFADADLSKAVQARLVTPKEAAWASTYRPKLEGLMRSGLNVGRISDALYADAVPLLPGAKQTNKFIFEKLSRGVITQSSVTALERNARLHPEWSPEKLNRYTAKELNTYYRNLGNQGVFKSKTFQDMARALFFAPQWIEGLVRSEARGYGQFAKLATTGKLGNIGKGMGTGLVAYFALSQVVNLLTRGKPTWENDEPGHKFDAWVPDVMQGSNGFFISPLSVFAETTHDAIKYIERGKEPLDVVEQLISNKLHPQVRAFRDLLGGKDFFGRPLYGWERVEQAAKDIAPVPMFARTGGYRGGAQRQVMSTLGIKATVAPTSVNDIYQLAANFKREHGLETSADKVRIESDYATLRRALQDGDLEQARVEYEELLKTKKASKVSEYFANYPKRAFTGSRAHDRAFKRSLDRGQMDIYNAALRERQEVARLFRELRGR